MQGARLCTIALLAASLAGCGSGSSSSSDPTPVGTPASASDDPTSGPFAPTDAPPTDATGTPGTSMPVPTDTSGEGTSDPSSGEPNSQGASPPALDEASNALIVAFTGYQVDARVTEVRELVATAIDTAISSQALADTTTTFPDGIAFINVATDVTGTNTEYACALGGRLVLGMAELEIRDGYSRDARAEAFRFEECRLASGGGGEAVLDGELTTLDDYDSGNRFSTRTLSYAWSGFSLARDGAVLLEIDGSTTVSDLNSELPFVTRTVELGRYVERDAGGEPVERLEDVSLTLTNRQEGGGLYRGYALAVSGSVTNGSTGDVPVAVDTVAPLSRYYSDYYVSTDNVANSDVG